MTVLNEATDVAKQEVQDTIGPARGLLRLVFVATTTSMISSCNLILGIGDVSFESGMDAATLDAHGEGDAQAATWVPWNFVGLTIPPREGSEALTGTVLPLPPLISDALATSMHVIAADNVDLDALTWIADKPLLILANRITVSGTNTIGTRNKVCSEAGGAAATGGSGGGGRTAGGAGGGGTTSGPPGGAIVSPSILRIGCNGSKGSGEPQLGQAGLGGGAVHLVGFTSIEFIGNSTIVANGLGGDGGDDGGGGGGAGGMIVLDSPAISFGTNVGVIAHGGGGGGGGDATQSGGNGGQGEQAMGGLGGVGVGGGGGGGQGGTNDSNGPEPGSARTGTGAGGGGGGSHGFNIVFTEGSVSSDPFSPAVSPPASP